MADISDKDFKTTVLKMAAQHYEYIQYPWTAYLKMTKAVNFVTCILQQF